MNCSHRWALLIALTAGRVTQSQGAQEPAALFRGDPARHGVYPAKLGEHFGGIRWRFHTEGPVRSSPAVVGSTLYVGSSDGRLYALGRRSGEQRWRFDAGSAINSSPAVAGGRVYFESQDGTVFAVAQGSGTLVWRTRTGADMALAWGHESGDLYLSSPVVSGGTVFIGSGDGRLYAMNAATGKLRWSLQTGGRVRSSPAVEGDTVYVGSMDGSLYAASAATGSLLWKYDTEGHGLNSGDFGYDRRTIQSSPAILGDLVVFGGRDGFLYGVERATGKLRWRVDHKISWVNTSAAVETGAVYSGTSDGHFIQRVDPATGTELWRTKIGSFSFSSPALAGSMIYQADGAGTIHALEKESGKEQWSYDIPAAIWSSVVPADSSLYFGSDDGGVYALATTSGPAFRRAVFWDSAYVRAARNVAAPERVRAALALQGYEVLGAEGLQRFMLDRWQDGAPSVVVFAIDCLPSTVAATASDTVLFRRYLDRGGKVVWLGAPPLLWPINPKTGESSRLKDIVWDAPRKLLGVDLARGIFHPHYRATSNHDGERWGLSGWWLTTWSADPATVTTTLAADETGLAASWVKRYGGGPGTGFVQLFGGFWEDRGSPPIDLRVIQFAADYRPAE